MQHMHPSCNIRLQCTHPPNMQTGNKVFPVSECNKIKLLSLTLSTSEQKEDQKLFTCLWHLAPSGSKLGLAGGSFYLLAGPEPASDHTIFCSQAEDYKPAYQPQIGAAWPHFNQRPLIVVSLFIN